MIVSKTPFRMSFVGGGSDLPAFYREETGAVVSTSIDKYMYIAVNRKFDERLRISYSRTEEVETPQQVAHPLVRHALEVAGIDGGIEIASMADIPSRGTGLGFVERVHCRPAERAVRLPERVRVERALARLACDIEIDRCQRADRQAGPVRCRVRRPESHPLSSGRLRVGRSRDLRAGGARRAGGVDAGVLHGPRAQASKILAEQSREYLRQPASDAPHGAARVRPEDRARIGPARKRRDRSSTRTGA